MKAFLRNNLAMIGLAVAGVLAAAGGAFAAVALGIGTAGPPTKTTTVQVGVGATGPAGPPGEVGPPGPQGPAGSGGADQCPTGSTFQSVILNHPGGQIELWVCVVG